jgi:hypothetical protein
MRRVRGFLAVSLLACVCAAHALGGCVFPFDLEHEDCAVYSHPGCSTGGGSGGMTPVGCIPNENDKPVDDTCGVFVSSSLGKDDNAGNKSGPVKTLQQAIALAAGNTGRVYACADGFEEAVEVPAGISVFGGLDCAMESPGTQWRYIGDKSKTALTAKAEQIPLVLLGGMGTTQIEDIAVTARSAENPGSSSIAAVVDGATTELVRCTFEAGDGTDGVAGESLPSAAKGGVQGKDGGNACSASSIIGADGVSSMCGDLDSTSGPGGSGFATVGGDGSRGSPGAAMNGGAGENISACTPGIVGEIGTPGTPGAGATDLGQLNKTGYTGVAGTNGTAGAAGQGGGGGGGAKGGTGAGQCIDPTKAGGASGGSGGSGGCGGAGGKGGGAGGSSIALVSVKATLTLTDVTLKTGNGGKGGDGGLEQEGGGGGQPGKGGGVGAASGLKPGCNGGLGGQGGKGGRGGGGLGGHAIGLAHSGESAPAMSGVTFNKKGTAGTGGKGADPAHDGTAGVAADLQVFP